MKSGGKGFCNFLMSYSLARENLKNDNLKGVIEQAAKENGLKSGLINPKDCFQVKNKLGIIIEKEIDEVENLKII